MYFEMETVCLGSTLCRYDKSMIDHKFHPVPASNSGQMKPHMQNTQWPGISIFPDSRSMLKTVSASPVSPSLAFLQIHVAFGSIAAADQIF